MAMAMLYMSRLVLLSTSHSTVPTASLRKRDASEWVLSGALT